MNPVHALQVRAFLNAAEDVDAEPDTIEDLLADLHEDDEDAEEGEDEEEELEEEPSNGRKRTADALAVEEEAAEERDLDMPVHESHRGDDACGSEDEDEESDIEIEADTLQRMEEEAAQAWTKDEVRKMMHHLKERGMSSFIKEYVVVQNIPVPKLLLAFGIVLCDELRHKRLKTLLYFLRVAISRELHLREKLPQYNTVADAVALLRNSRRIVVLTGAGISVSCGIPDFRSRDGLYASLKEKGEYELDDPQQMFDIQYFKENPAGANYRRSQIYPSNFIPSPCHRFIKVIEDKGKLLRNYTQNIDTLETRAGIERVLQCHGSFRTASCTVCRRRVPGAGIEPAIMARRVPYCTLCAGDREADRARGRGKGKRRARKEWEESSDEEEEEEDMPVGVMKPDITFFGEKLTDDFDHALLADRETVDLLLVIGTSLKVSPVSEILSHLPHSVPQILINKTPVRHINPDIVLLGNADAVVQHLCAELGWDLPPPPAPSGTHKAQGQDQGNLGSMLSPPQPPIANLRNSKRPSSSSDDPTEADAGVGAGRAPPVRAGNTHIWLFEGAEGGAWVDAMVEKRRKEQDSEQKQPENGNGKRVEEAQGASTTAPVAQTQGDEPPAKKLRTS
ncbi:DHS-like NAD/FAD-binding domain-containing protein [Coniophora puteana RWD-64-598 SS2]|uniref:DHS-like NAD/FAD-binding domain-containing protein n=1 Tax=Coniophora puteana (strain RWD-64-598) TaxID=741705 RepID=A0A5M3MIK6_CONPW|nr:DHS-like NAD/FAD-binding domain-containing protein [Coniophora puteana RWD-64-598 SS2]EIW79042.1 DHS-like NAD/FAD-binding domain-containing protein [Coniophora puteana RWD-64-598 SS2]